MNKEEFLNGLTEKLLEDLPPGAVQEQVEYYRGYIDGELKKGKTEEEITFDLGDPILIARNLVESPQSYRVNNTNPYEQGITESEYPDTRGLMGEEVPEDHVPENADAYAEAFEKESQGSENSTRGYKEADRERAAFDNGFFDSGMKQSVERGGPSSIFKRADGGINWKLISIILIIVLVVVAVVGITAKIVITFWPIILIMLIISIIFSRNDRK